MPEHPAELQEGGEGGGSGGRIHIGGIGGPGEMPPPDRQRTSVSQLVNEIFRMRARINGLENALLAQSFAGGARTMAYFGSGIGGPNEMPEGGDEGGGGGIFHVHIPGEINELAASPGSRVIAEVAQLTSRFAQLERSVMGQLQAINKRLDAMQK